MNFDGIVIGGGPAGMFASIIAAQQGNKVLLIERNDRLGKKLLITGKGRCNVTNACTSQEVLQNIPRNGRFLYSAMENFPPSSIMEFFESHGCQLKVERGNRVFPVTDKSSSVLECLRNVMHRSGVQVKTGRVQQILTDDIGVVGVRINQESLSAKWVILATGGVSYPTTGSTGDGYAMAEKLGLVAEYDENIEIGLKAAVEKTTVRQLAEKCKAVFGTAACTLPEKQVEKVFICAGSGSGMTEEILDSGAECFITGECKYHDMLDLSAMGVAVIAVAHDASEKISLEKLALILENENIKTEIYTADNLQTVI